MYKVRVYSLRYFRKDGKQQWSDGREKFAQMILKACQKRKRNFNDAVKIATEIADILQLIGWYGDVTIQSDGNSYTSTLYQISVKVG